MTELDYKSAKLPARILYDETGMIYTNHPDIMKSMNEYANKIVDYCKKYPGQTEHLTTDFIISRINDYK